MTKKRIRPTLTQVRALEGEIQQRDLTIKQLQEKLKNQRQRLSLQEKKLCEFNVLEQSNKLMEKELNRMRRAVNNLNELNDRQERKIFELENRGFWARLFNL